MYLIPARPPHDECGDLLRMVAFISRNMLALRARIQTGYSLRGHRFSGILFFRNLNETARNYCESTHNAMIIKGTLMPLVRLRRWDSLG
uniref:Uncharacterized protein n=1 Tax=Candidatus Kentrum sp. TC TaxID=2126339 RepID=A0A450YB52_9GAMM|nr:MAG: hypothetical protein BECKTC1821D_GA0114238_100572 [Candidatus Kentron sp. TC]